MAKPSRTITFSLPPELADRVDEILIQEGRTRSALLRSALIRYIEECEWKKLLQYGERRAREKGVGTEDVGLLVERHRAETAASRK